MSESNPNSQSLDRSSPLSRADAPIAANCRAKRMGDIAAFAECLVKPPPNCPFGFVYGYGYFCRHPRRDQIIARTQAADRPR